VTFSFYDFVCDSFDVLIQLKTAFY